MQSPKATATAGFRMPPLSRGRSSGGAGAVGGRLAPLAAGAAAVSVSAETIESGAPPSTSKPLSSPTGAAASAAPFSFGSNAGSGGATTPKRTATISPYSVPLTSTMQPTTDKPSQTRLAQRMSRQSGGGSAASASAAAPPASAASSVAPPSAAAGKRLHKRSSSQTPSPPEQESPSPSSPISPPSPLSPNSPSARWIRAPRATDSSRKPPNALTRASSHAQTSPAPSASAAATAASAASATASLSAASAASASAPASGATSSSALKSAVEEDDAQSVCSTTSVSSSGSSLGLSANLHMRLQTSPYLRAVATKKRLLPLSKVKVRSNLSSCSASTHSHSCASLLDGFATDELTASLRGSLPHVCSGRVCSRLYVPPHSPRHHCLPHVYLCVCCRILGSRRCNFLSDARRYGGCRHRRGVRFSACGADARRSGSGWCVASASGDCFAATNACTIPIPIARFRIAAHLSVARAASLHLSVHFQP
jgi:hypothetical protein